MRHHVQHDFQSILTMTTNFSLPNLIQNSHGLKEGNMLTYYIADSTHLNIAFAVSKLAKLSHKPNYKHLSLSKTYCDT